MHQLSDQIERKFIDVMDASEWEIETDTGWEPLIDVKKTVEYEIYRMELSDGMFLESADNHIVFDQNMNEVFVKELKPNDLVQTKFGLKSVIHVTSTRLNENMYDLGVNSSNHRYYSNNILSHNTTCAAAYIIWFAMFIPDSTILIAAHKYSGAQEIMQRIRYAYEHVPDHIRDAVVDYNKGSMTFANGSRIISATTTETTGRGLSISLLYSDEFSFVRPTIAREFWTSISPTLSTGGKAIITSTPNSDEDTFSHIWRDANKTWDEYGNECDIGKNGFKAFKADWSVHPDRDQKWADEERSRLGDEKFRREHCLEFIRDDELLISSLKLASMEGKDPIYKQGQIRWYKKPERQFTYLVSLDPSLGTGGDPAAIQVFEMPTLIQVGEWQHNRTMIPGQIEVLRQITQHIKETAGEDTVIYWSVENNTIGEAALIVINEMGEENIPGTFLSEPAKMGSGRRYRRGFTTTNKSKLAACSKLKNLIETDRMTVNSKLLISELKNFVAIGGSYKAKLGEKDDLVMSTLLVVRMGQYISGFDDKIYDKFAEKFEADYQVPLPIYILR